MFGYFSIQTLVPYSLLVGAQCQKHKRSSRTDFRTRSMELYVKNTKEVLEQTLEQARSMELNVKNTKRGSRIDFRTSRNNHKHRQLQMPLTRRSNGITM